MLISLEITGNDVSRPSQELIAILYLFYLDLTGRVRCLCLLVYVKYLLDIHATVRKPMADLVALRPLYTFGKQYVQVPHFVYHNLYKK